jgi:hypothetical protein
MGKAGSLKAKKQGSDLNQTANTMGGKALVNMEKLSINQQMTMFPPMINTLYLEKEIEREYILKNLNTFSRSLSLTKGKGVESK